MTTDIIGEYGFFCDPENETPQPPSNTPTPPIPVPPIFTISGEIIVVENTNPQSVKRYKRYKKIKYKKRSAHSSTIFCVIT